MRICGWASVRYRGVAQNTPANQRFAGLATHGTLAITVGEFDPGMDGMIVVLGMDVRGQAITYDNIFLPLTE
jgi:hypothetical protein